VALPGKLNKAMKPNSKKKVFFISDFFFQNSAGCFKTL